MIDEPWPIRSLATEAHRDTRDLGRKHHGAPGYPLSLEKGSNVRRAAGMPGLPWRFWMLRRLRIPFEKHFRQHVYIYKAHLGGGNPGVLSDFLHSSIPVGAGMVSVCLRAPGRQPGGLVRQTMTTKKKLPLKINYKPKSVSASVFLQELCSTVCSAPFFILFFFPLQL